MSETSPISLRRYRRRILTLGVVAFTVVFAVGAAVAVPVVQNDLEDRVESELSANGIDGVTASFSGQDGTLVCAQPLDDPDSALTMSRSLRGVHAVRLDTTCATTERSVATDAPVASSPASSAVTTSSTSTSTPTTDAAPSDTSPTSEAEVESGSIVDVLAEDPLFDQLSELVESAGLDAVLGQEGPITLFAPTDAAFDEAFDTLGADAFGALTSDDEVVRALLLQHLTEGALTSESFVDGEIEMLDGSTVVIDAEALTFTSGGSVAGVADPDTQLDIRASNGVVHAIDRILIPADFELPLEPDAAMTTSVEYVDGRVTMIGAVADAGQRDRLVSAAETAVDASNVVDGLTVVETSGPTPVEIERLASVTAAMVDSLVSGQATLQGGNIAATGIPFETGGAAALEELGLTSGITVQLEERPVADPASATELQEELNDFVADNPIRFDAGSIELTPDSIPIVDQVAARAARLAGVDIVVIGYTDTAGSEASNQLFSLGRANTVRDAMIERGIAVDAVTAEGRGETDPVLGPDGTEDQEASRRVEFAVSSR